jgi:hypothetical protein
MRTSAIFLEGEDSHKIKNPAGITQAGPLSPKKPNQTFIFLCKQAKACFLIF